MQYVHIHVGTYVYVRMYRLMGMCIIHVHVYECVYTCVYMYVCVYM